jgi:toxin FitB
MSFLIDTNVLSEYSRSGGPNPGVKHWLETTGKPLLHVSVITLAEIQKGIALLDEGKRRRDLERWLKDELETWFLGRVLLLDRTVAERWAVLVAHSIRIGRPLPTLDSQIAATALAHDLTVVTRNTRDFESAGVRTFNPWT